MQNLDDDEAALAKEALGAPPEFNLRGEPFRRRGLTFQRCVLPLGSRDSPSQSVHVRAFVGAPQRPFFPRGLAIWNAPHGAMVSQAIVGSQAQVVCAAGNVPCKFFAMGDSYAQIAALLDQGKEPPASCDWDLVNVGSHVLVTIVGEGAHGDLGKLELAMWGTCIL